MSDIDIIGIEHITDEQLEYEIERGGQFVTFNYTVSFLVLSWSKESDIYFFRADETTFWTACKYNLLTLFTGLWSIIGIFFIIRDWFVNISGGNDVTDEAIAMIGLFEDYDDDDDDDYDDRRREKNNRYSNYSEQPAPSRNGGGRGRGRGSKSGGGSDPFQKGGRSKDHY